jgi:hypothetical protein
MWAAARRTSVSCSRPPGPARLGWICRSRRARPASRNAGIPVVTADMTALPVHSWTVPDFYPIDYLPRGVRLSAYAGSTTGKLVVTI